MVIVRPFQINPVPIPSEKGTGLEEIEVLTLHSQDLVTEIRGRITEKRCQCERDGWKTCASDIMWRGNQESLDVHLLSFHFLLCTERWMIYFYIFFLQTGQWSEWVW